jgi:hypothetical protein
MYDAIVSSASSNYRIYWDCRNAIYYIDIPRGVRNPKELPLIQKYAASGVWVSGWNNHGAAAFNKVARRLTSYAQDINANETATIRWRKDKGGSTLDVGWTTLVALDSIGENDEVETDYASKAGLEYNTIQYRVNLARGGTNTNSPDLQAITHSYRRLGFHNTFSVEIDGTAGSKSPKTYYDQLISDAGSATFLEFTFRDQNSDAAESHFVFIDPASLRALLETGSYGSRFSLLLIEP